MANLLDDLLTAADHLGKRVREFEQALRSAWANAEDAHRRAARLNAYRQRKRWKGGDAKRLRTIGLGKAGLRRLERMKLAKPRGRPVVPAYVPLADRLAMLGRLSNRLFDPSTPPYLRRRALQTTPWCEYFVEAVYRGEYEVAKAAGVPSPSFQAERATGQAVGLEPDSVRRIAGVVRRMRRLNRV